MDKIKQIEICMDVAQRMVDETNRNGESQVFSFDDLEPISALAIALMVGSFFKIANIDKSDIQQWANALFSSIKRHESDEFRKIDALNAVNLWRLANYLVRRYEIGPKLIVTGKGQLIFGGDEFDWLKK